jgi:predicted GNAT superfamily acetyltransferase
VSEEHGDQEQIRERLEVSTVHDPRGALEVADLFDRVWGTRMMVSPEVIVACLHNGAYASVTRLDDVVVGAAFGFVGRSLAGVDGPNLHSHAAGVLPNVSACGLGTAIKRHQWRWARDNGFATITWTFDPLVRRNAWFNLVTLGAEVLGYHENFYGELTDGINAGEQSDRLLVRWDVVGRDEFARGSVVEPTATDVVIDTPPDIESLRTVNRSLAGEWRLRQRAEFAAAGRRVVAGVNASYSYVLRNGR